MKKTILISSALLLTGCLLDRQDAYDVDYVMEFQPAMLMHVSGEESECFPPGQSIAVRAWELPEQDSWKEAASSAQEFLPLTEILPFADGKTWGFEDPVLWPQRHKRLTFLAYSPFDAGAGCDAETGVSFLDVDVVGNPVDLLYTDPVEDVDKMECGGTVVLPFRHALCSMNFKIKNRVQTQEQIVVKNITLENVNYKGDFHSLLSPQWTLESERTSFVFFEGEYQTGHLPEDIGQRYLMVPQSLDTQVKVEYDFFTEQGTFISQKLSTVSMRTVLEPGVNYSFTLSVGIDDVIFLVEIIEDSLEK